METLGSRIRRLRQSYQYSQEYLGTLLKVDRRIVANWESDILFPKADKIAELCKLFNVTSDYLLFGTNETNRESAIEQAQEEQTLTTNSETDEIAAINSGNKKSKTKMSKGKKIFPICLLSLLALIIIFITTIIGISYFPNKYGENIYEGIEIVDCRLSGESITYICILCALILLSAIGILIYRSVKKK